MLCAKYLTNFSVFRSVPDHWALDQLFPIVPIHHLNKLPSEYTTLCDITCDSDGKIDQFIDLRDVRNTLQLHPYTGEPYYLGGFLLGAYQEILGDMHNLFGDTNAVNVILDESTAEGWRLDGAEAGDSTTDLLRYVHLAPEKLASSYRRKADAANLTTSERTKLLAELESGLSGYTYLT